jgi:hypothetical protein
MWEMTMNMMDRAKEYIDATGKTNFGLHHHFSAVRLSMAIEEKYGKVSLNVLEEIANQVLVEVKKLM